MKLRADEEAERRRNQRIIGDIEEDEDFDAFEQRQKAEAINDQSEDGQREDIEGAEYDDELDRQEGDEEEYDEEDDFDGNRTTGESDVG